MSLLEFVDWFWPSWWWALPMIVAPCLFFWLLCHSLECPVLIKLESEYVQSKYNIDKKKPEGKFAVWCVKQYSARPALYNMVVTLLMLLYYGFLLLLGLTIPVPRFPIVVIVLILLQYSCIGSPCPIEKHGRRIAEDEIEELIDENYRLQVLASDSLEAGLDQVLADISRNDTNPGERVRSFLWHTKPKGGDLGKLADGRLWEHGLDKIPPWKATAATYRRELEVRPQRQFPHSCSHAEHIQSWLQVHRPDGPTRKRICFAGPQEDRD